MEYEGWMDFLSTLKTNDDRWRVSDMILKMKPSDINIYERNKYPEIYGILL